MKKLCIFFLLFTSATVFSQVQDAWVYFNAKPSAQIYLDAPDKMLSQRALDRRANQNISLDSKDIPIEQSYINQVKTVSGIAVLAKSKWFSPIKASPISL